MTRTRCDACGGTGCLGNPADSDYASIPCVACEGDGWLEEPVQDADCSLCGGDRTSALSDAEPCPRCGGRGAESAEPSHPNIIPVRDIVAAMPLSMLLGQAQVWQPKDGPPIRLEDMGSRHRRNTLRWLRRRASKLSWAVVMEEITGPLAARGERAQDAESEWAEWMGAHPEEWLEAEPLVVRLAALVAEDEAQAHAAATRPRTPEEIF